MPNPHQRLVRNQIRQAGFPYGYRQQAEQKILETIWNIRVQRRIVKNLYSAYNNTKIGGRPPQVGAGRPSKSAQITYLISVLNTVWMQGMKKKPSVHRRGSNTSQFVLFAEPILMSLRIFNVIDNLNAFKSYRKRLSRIIDRRSSVLVTMKKLMREFSQN
jgi:hypothetical protein